MIRCKKCLLPSTYAKSQIDTQGICAFCRGEFPKHLELWESSRPGYEENLKETLRHHHRKGDYDALVCLSGGKDSLYLLHRLTQEYKLKVLAFTTDINIPPIAWSNIERTVKVLNLDHLIYRPSESFYRKLFRYLLMNQEARGAVYTISYVYAPLFEGDAIRTATEMNIPLVFAGYSPGQPEPQRMIYEFSRQLLCHTDWTPPQLKRSGVFSDEELSRFWNPLKYPVGTGFPRYIAPFHAWEYHQDEVMKKVVEWGLVKKSSHASPILSNYPIQWLLMFSDLKNLGYNPYAPEFCALIREGKANINEWRWQAPLVDWMIQNKVFLGHACRECQEWLNLKDDDLKIIFPEGVYDPPGISRSP